jgi:chromosomal replication initiation ATPase DnaA
MYLTHVAAGLPMTEVGRLFARDRTTVAHASAVIEDRRDDPVFDRSLAVLEMTLKTAAPCAGGWKGGAS